MLQQRAMSVGSILLVLWAARVEAAGVTTAFKAANTAAGAKQTASTAACKTSNFASLPGQTGPCCQESDGSWRTCFFGSDMPVFMGGCHDDEECVGETAVLGESGVCKCILAGAQCGGAGGRCQGGTAPTAAPTPAPPGAPAVAAVAPGNASGIVESVASTTTSSIPGAYDWVSAPPTTLSAAAGQTIETVSTSPVPIGDPIPPVTYTAVPTTNDTAASVAATATSAAATGTGLARLYDSSTQTSGFRASGLLNGNVVLVSVSVMLSVMGLVFGTRRLTRPFVGTTDTTQYLSAPIADEAGQSSPVDVVE